MNHKNTKGETPFLVVAGRHLTIGDNNFVETMAYNNLEQWVNTLRFLVESGADQKGTENEGNDVRKRSVYLKQFGHQKHKRSARAIAYLSRRIVSSGSALMIDMEHRATGSSCTQIDIVSCQARQSACKHEALHVENFPPTTPSEMNGQNQHSRGICVVVEDPTRAARRQHRPSPSIGTVARVVSLAEYDPKEEKGGLGGGS